ncbi:MAG: hypothetical protein KDD81_05385 [Rhodobacteraceae bacterium]|nr:hypothetical protein [Paracoccaceae bacterium]
MEPAAFFLRVHDLAGWYQAVTGLVFRFPNGHSRNVPMHCHLLVDSP